MQSKVETSPGELLPCPFCGSEASLVKYEDRAFMVVCANIRCPCETFKYGTEFEAKQACGLVRAKGGTA